MFPRSLRSLASGRVHRSLLIRPQFRVARLVPLLGSGAVVLLLTFGSVAPAMADSVSTTATIDGGSLAESSSAAPTPLVTLNGADQTTTYTVPITTTDPTGTGAGWNLTITSTTLSCASLQGCTPTHNFSTSASQITSVAMSCAGGSTCTNPTNAITYPLTIPAGASAPTAVKFYNAAADTGPGKFTITPTVTLSVPANTYIGTYVSTITLTITAAP